MDYSPYSFLTDIAFMSILIILGQFIRARFKIVQNLFLPASMIAGILGLILGPYFLNIIPFSTKMSSYPYMFIIVIFGALFVGKPSIPPLKKVIKDAGDTFAFNQGIEFLEFGICLVVGGPVLKALWPDTNVAFPLAMPGGFFGGHGYGSSLMGSVQLQNNWEEAMDVVFAFATIGILVGVIVGVFWINIGVRRGWARFTKNMSELPEEMVTGLVPEGKRASIGTATTHNMTLNSLSFHLAVVLVPFLGGYFGTKFFLKLWPTVSLPETSLAMVSGLLLLLLFKRIRIRGKGLDDYVDESTCNRVSGVFGDYLVAFGIASINPNLVVKYAGPIIFMSVLGVACVSVYLWFAKRLYHNFWFERAIFIFGWGTGTVAIGMTLCKIIDPDYKSGTVEDYGLAYLLIGIMEVVFVTAIPPLVCAGYGFITGAVCLVIWAALMLFVRVVYGLQSKNGSELRKGEAEVIRAYRESIGSRDA